jgi:hypothetical protein
MTRFIVKNRQQKTCVTMRLDYGLDNFINHSMLNTMKTAACDYLKP